MVTAVEERLIAESPCRRISLPRVENVERRFLHASEIERLAVSIDSRYRGLVYVGAYCGLRWGELGGLRREHLDIDKRRINVVGLARACG
jgi:integrase